MKNVAVWILMLSVALWIAIPRASAADDGGTLYKSKCAMCHGADGAGKPAAKIPSLVSDESKKATDAALTDDIANGGPDKKPAHAFQNKGLSPDQIKMIVSYIRDMQKK